MHQQEVNEPFKVLELEGRYDVVARIAGGGVSGQAAPCASAWPAP